MSEDEEEQQRHGEFEKASVGSGRMGCCPPSSNLSKHIRAARVQRLDAPTRERSHEFRARRRRGRARPSGSALCSAGGHPVARLLRRDVRGPRSDRRALDRARLPRHACDRDRRGIGAADERVNVWLAAHRTPTRTDASLIGSIVAGGVVLPIIAGVLALVLRSSASGGIAAFFVFALAVESATYRATTLVVHSHRPRVVRLESLPVNASYPSGHTAAAIAVYCGLALLLTSGFTNALFRVVAWAARRRDGRVRRDGRACTAACTTRSTSPGGIVRRHRGADRRRLRCLRPARLPRTESGARHEGRSDRARRARRSAAACRSYGASSRPKGVADPFWVEVPKSRRLRRRCSARSTRARSSSSPGAATGWCSAASTSSPGSRCSARDHPGRHREPLRDESRASRKDIEEAVAIGLRGDRRELDVGRFNGERFAVMAGAGFDAAMIRDSGDGGLKERFGRAAYVWSGSENLRSKPFRAKIEVDGRRGTRARRAASCSATSASSSAASRCSRTRVRTTESSRSAS